MAEPTHQDPFRGTRTAKVAGVAPPLPADRLRALGATDAEVHEATLQWSQLTEDQQTLTAAMMAEQTDDDLLAAIESDRADAWARGEVAAGRHTSEDDALAELAAAGEWLQAVDERANADDKQRLQERAEHLARLQQWATDLVRAGEYATEAEAADAIGRMLTGDAEPVAMTGVVAPPEAAAAGSGSDGADGAGPAAASAGPATDTTGAGAADTPAPVADLVHEGEAPAPGYPEGGGTVAGVLGWVGGGADAGERRVRALYALQQEHTRPADDQRKTLIDAVSRIAGE